MKTKNTVATFAATLITTGALIEGSNAATIYTDFASFNMASTTSITESFDGVSAPLPGVESITSNGNTYSDLDGDLSNGLLVGNYFSGLGGDSQVLTHNRNGDYTITFGSSSRTAIGFNIFYNGAANNLTIQLNGASGVLDTFVRNEATAQSFLGFTESEAITSIRITATNGNIVNVGLDNLREGVIAVPEPSSALLLVLGSLSLAFRRSRH